LNLLNVLKKNGMNQRNKNKSTIFHTNTLQMGKDKSLIWNVHQNPCVVEGHGKMRELTTEEKRQSFSKTSIWLKLNVGFDMLTTYIFLSGPVLLQDVLKAMMSYYHGQVTPSEKQVYLKSNVISYAWFPKVNIKEYMKNATRADLRGDSLYLESFRKDNNVFTPSFGS